ncbi:bifunctional chorismate mutase/prephenate dehydrogenase [Haliangium ochraceum]|uniref:chorismate mutase n=1 Tax=Haliangium ochraceum (strain DSM 14365 / JCM 11303 / SMP-2) TaxID=502025 RepID=D0LRS3_HALO1|nr:bifunctional chorismate mutase/prephenate dehydrogenase [Haliangium ochraceum]ACY19065.1 chorismate mutase [Haliangium ochraceum DSM 14365]
MSLDTLRNDLQSLDREILALVAKRQALAAEIGSIKRAAGVPTRDYGQERAVLERAREHADEMGISPALAEQILLLLIRSSLTVQERDRVAALGSGTGQRVLVIGGSGNMGRWFARFLGSQGYAVTIADPTPAPAELRDCDQVSDFRDTSLDQDIIVVATPMMTANAILHELAERKPKGLVFDVGSLKSPLRTGLAALVQAGVSATSLHPMFGPNTELLSGRHVVFVDIGVPEATSRARDLFASTMVVQVELDLENHDRLIAYVLGLSHALNIAFASALAESGEAAPRLAKMSSTTFDAQLEVSTRVAMENPQLYYEIQSLNDYGTESLTALLYAVERLRSLVRAGDAKGFAALMERGRAYLQDRRSDVDPRTRSL